MRRRSTLNDVLRRSVRPAAYQRVTLVALVTLGLIIVTGAAVRLTGSGLGCSDWPNCEQSQLVPDRGNLHAAIEFGNRLVTIVVGIPVLATFVGSFRRVPRRRDLTWWSLGLIVGVVAQVIVGKFVVETDLAPNLVIVHFLLSMVLLWNALVLYHKAGEPDVGTVHASSDGHLLGAGRALVALSMWVLVTGTVVTGTGPHAGDPDTVERLPYFLPDVARLHSVGVIVFCAATVVLTWHLHRVDAPSPITDATHRLLGAIVVQGAIGYVQYFTGVPALLVAFHVFGAILVWLAVLEVHHAIAVSPADAHGDLTERPAVLVQS